MSCTNSQLRNPELNVSYDGSPHTNANCLFAYISNKDNNPHFSFHSILAAFVRIFLHVFPFDPRYESSWDKSNKTKLLQDGLERAGRRDLAERLRCLHWGQQRLSRRVELPSAFPYLITVHKTINNKEGLRRINELNRRYT